MQQLMTSILVVRIPLQNSHYQGLSWQQEDSHLQQLQHNLLPACQIDQLEQKGSHQGLGRPTWQMKVVLLHLANLFCLTLPGLTLKGVKRVESQLVLSCRPRRQVCAVRVVSLDTTLRLALLGWVNTRLSPKKKAMTKKCIEISNVFHGFMIIKM
jgi:hypothetical protein